MVYKIKSCEKVESGVCQHCGIWRQNTYLVTIEDLFYSHTFDICYECFNWLHEEYDIEVN